MSRIGEQCKVEGISYVSGLASDQNLFVYCDLTIVVGILRQISVYIVDDHALAHLTLRSQAYLSIQDFIGIDHEGFADRITKFIGLCHIIGAILQICEDRGGGVGLLYPQCLYAADTLCACLIGKQSGVEGVIIDRLILVFIFYQFLNDDGSITGCYLIVHDDLLDLIVAVYGKGNILCQAVSGRCGNLGQGVSCTCDKFSFKYLGLSGGDPVQDNLSGSILQCQMSSCKLFVVRYIHLGDLNSGHIILHDNLCCCSVCVYSKGHILSEGISIRCCGLS